MLGGLGQDAGISLPQGALELGEQFIRFLTAALKEPLEGLEHEALDRADRQGAGVLAARVPAHAVRHDKQVALVLTLLKLRQGQAGCFHLQRLEQLSDQELVLVALPHLAGIRQSGAAYAKQQPCVWSRDGRYVARFDDGHVR